jgi:hypothetical protein
MDSVINQIETTKLEIEYYENSLRHLIRSNVLLAEAYEVVLSFYILQLKHYKGKRPYIL